MQPWSRLLEAREAQELTQRDIADALNLPINIVDALETGDLSKLPDRVFTRGYVRAYAKYLDLDADALVTAYDAEVEAEPAVDASSHAESKTGALPAWLLQPPALIGAGVIVLLLVVIGFMSTGSEDAPEATEPVAISDERVVDPAHQLVAQPQGTASSTDTSAPAESLADKSDADAVTEVFSRGELQDDQQENAQAAQLENPRPNRKHSPLIRLPMASLPDACLIPVTNVLIWFFRKTVGLRSVVPTATTCMQT